MKMVKMYIRHSNDVDVDNAVHNDVPGCSNANVCVLHSAHTPLKINGWNIIMEVWFRSCSFLFMGDL